MNRRLYGAAILVLAVAAVFYYKTNSTHPAQSQDLASKSTAPIQPTFSSSNETANNQTEKQVVVSARQPNQVLQVKSGKYSIHISQPLEIDQEAQKRDEYLNKNKTNRIVNLADGDWVLMKLRASLDKKNSYRSHELGHDMYPIDSALAQKAIISTDSYPVVYKASNGHIGLLTGVLLARVASQSAAERLSALYPMNLMNYDSSIRLASFKVQEGQGFFDVYNQVKQNEKLESLTAEVLDSYKGY